MGIIFVMTEVCQQLEEVKKSFQNCNNFEDLIAVAAFKKISMPPEFYLSALEPAKAKKLAIEHIENQIDNDIPLCSNQIFFRKTSEKLRSFKRVSRALTDFLRTNICDEIEKSNLCAFIEQENSLNLDDIKQMLSNLQK